MSALTEHLERLQSWLRRNADAPTWTGLRIVESRHVRYGAVDTIPSAALLTVEAFEPRFDVLFSAGYSWINLSARGVLGDDLLVCIELPRDTVGAPPGRTSVNLSGPPLDQAGSCVWDASLRTRLVDE